LNITFITLRLLRTDERCLVHNRAFSVVCVSRVIRWTLARQSPPLSKFDPELRLVPTLFTYPPDLQNSPPSPFLEQDKFHVFCFCDSLQVSECLAQGIEFFLFWFPTAARAPFLFSNLPCSMRPTSGRFRGHKEFFLFPVPQTFLHTNRRWTEFFHTE